MAKKKDYYQTLGVEKTADAKEIKQAYRRLAKRYHPDANPDKNAEARFKEINEAYEVLSDPEKRAHYDQFGSATPGGFPGGWQPNSGSGGFTNVEDLGDSPFGDIFESLFGRRGNRGTGTTRERGGFGGQPISTAGQDFEQPVTISLREAYSGATRVVTKGDRKVKVSIPAGANNGTKVRLAGEGSPGFNGGANGDLYLVVEVTPEAGFERQGDHVTVDVRVDWAVAMLGGEAEVPTLDRPVKLRVPAGTQSGRKFRLAGKGMPIMKKPGEAGDLFARILITIPEQLTPEQRKLAEALRDSLR